jgi:hypothetical protein
MYNRCRAHMLIAIMSQIPTKLFTRAVRILLWFAQRVGVSKHVDWAAIITNRTETLLNLPGELPFFPTKVTDTSKIAALFRRLHPVACDKELIRLGPPGDGGYLVPNDLDGITACFSPGVSNVAGFEKDCAALGMHVFMADASVSGPPENNARFQFSKKYVGAVTRGEFIDFSEWVNQSISDSGADLLLQIDIEGYEYETFLSAPSSLIKRFRIIIVEFHYIDHLFSDPLFSIYSTAFEKLLLTHTCVHIHPNNVTGTINVKGMNIPQMAEFTFLRNDRVSNPRFVNSFPHALDRQNVDGPSVPLPQFCYRSE